MPVSYGKLYIKDANGTIKQIIPEAYSVNTNYVGATASANGVAGLVPPAQSSQRDKFLRGDASWAEISLPAAYTGATSSSAGVAGLVPPAAIAERDRYLKGDGTWAELTLPNVYQGATSSASGVAGLVPAATSAERSKYLKGDGTWAEIADIDTSTLLLDNYQKAASISAVSSSDSVLQAIGKLEKAIDGKQDSGSYLTASSTLDATKLSGTASIDTTGNASTATKATQDGSGNVIATTYATKSELPADYVGATANANGVHGLVPAATSAEKDCFLCGDGTWDAMTGMTNAQIDTAMANVGYVGDIDPSLLTSITNSEIDALFA